jgi:hypothetical protein
LQVASCAFRGTLNDYDQLEQAREISAIVESTLIRAVNGNARVELINTAGLEVGLPLADEGGGPLSGRGAGPPPVASATGDRDEVSDDEPIAYRSVLD